MRIIQGKAGLGKDRKRAQACQVLPKPAQFDPAPSRSAWQGPCPSLRSKRTSAQDGHRRRELSLFCSRRSFPQREFAHDLSHGLSGSIDAHADVAEFLRERGTHPCAELTIVIRLLGLVTENQRHRRRSSKPWRATHSNRPPKLPALLCRSESGQDGHGRIRLPGRLPRVQGAAGQGERDYARCVGGPTGRKRYVDYDGAAHRFRRRFVRLHDHIALPSCWCFQSVAPGPA